MLLYREKIWIKKTCVPPKKTKNESAMPWLMKRLGQMQLLPVVRGKAWEGYAEMCRSMYDDLTLEKELRPPPLPPQDPPHGPLVQAATLSTTKTGRYSSKN